MNSLGSAVLIAMMFFPSESVFANQVLAPATTAYQIEWPNYSSPPWVIAGAGPLLVQVSIPIENNKYVYGPVRYGINVGEIRTFADSIVSQTAVISEISVLDYGPVLRLMRVKVNDSLVPISIQIKMKDKWEEVPLRYKFSIEIVDPRKVIQKGELHSVIVKFSEGDVEKIKVEIKNKPLSDNKSSPKK